MVHIYNITTQFLALYLAKYYDPFITTQHDPTRHNVIMSKTRYSSGFCRIIN